jgi:cytochrome P450
MLGWAKPWNMARIHVAHRRGTAMPKGFLNVRGPFDDAVFEEISRAKQDPRLEERDDILAMLLKTRHEDGTAMEDRDLRDQMTTLLIQGHQTTAAALAWALERLMRHPEALERLRADVQNDQDEYLDAVFKETLRIRPPLPIIPRMVVKQPYQLGEYEIPVGAMVVPCIYMLHRHPDVYDEPKRFRPERFLEQPEGRYTWIPFGGGDRHCVGRSFATAEFKTALRLIVQRVRLTPTEQKDEKIARRGILFAPGSGAKAIIQERVEAPASRVAA